MAGKTGMTWDPKKKTEPKEKKTISIPTAQLKKIRAVAAKKQWTEAKVIGMCFQAGFENLYGTK